MAKELFVCSFGYRFLESQCRQGFRGVDVCRYANFFPSFCIDSTRCLGLAGELNSVAAQQQMCGQTIAGGQTKDYLRDFGRIAVLSAPQRLKRLDKGPLRMARSPGEARERLCVHERPSLFAFPQVRARTPGRQKTPLPAPGIR